MSRAVLRHVHPEQYILSVPTPHLFENIPSLSKTPRFFTVNGAEVTDKKKKKSNRNSVHLQQQLCNWAQHKHQQRDLGAEHNRNQLGEAGEDNARQTNSN